MVRGLSPKTELSDVPQRSAFSDGLRPAVIQLRKPFHDPLHRAINAGNSNIAYQTSFNFIIFFQ